MSYTYKDFIIDIVEKSPSVEKTTTYWKRVNSDGTVQNYSEDNYDTTIITRITYQNDGEIYSDIIEKDVTILEGWTIRLVFDDSVLKYKVCLQNNLIIFSENKALINKTVNEVNDELLTILLIQNTYSEKSNEKKTLVYDYLNGKKYSVSYEDKTIIASEKISLIQKTGNTTMNTRLYFSDNSSELFENNEFPVMKGWTLRSIYINENETDDKLYYRFIVENMYFFKGDRYSDKSLIRAEDKLIFKIRNESRFEAEDKYKGSISIRKMFSAFNTILFIVSAIYSLKDKIFTEIYQCFLDKTFTFTLTSLKEFVELYYFPALSLVFSVLLWIFLSNKVRTTEKKQANYENKVFEDKKSKILNSYYKLKDDFSKICPVETSEN